VGIDSVSVIGATGYLGAHISLALAQAGLRVNAWGRRQPAGIESWSARLEKFGTADLAEDRSVDRILADEPDAIVYCVSLDHHESEQDPDRALNVNVRPVWHMLDKLRRRAPYRFVFLSTSQVYGQAEGVVTEKSPVQPRNHYGLTHLMAENIVQRYRTDSGACGVSLRLSNGFGPPVFDDANCWWLVVNDFCRTAVEQGRIQLKSDGRQWRNFVHLDDVAAAVARVLEYPSPAELAPAYNVGGGENLSILALAHRVAEIHGSLTGREIPVLMPDGSVSLNDRTSNEAALDYSTASIARLGFSPTVPLDTGIADFLQHLSERRNT
jgi:UDP-glucose 4-epimerase